MVSHSELLEAFHEEVTTVPESCLARDHGLSAETRRLLTEVGVPDFDSTIVADAELEKAGPRSLRRVYEELGDAECPSSVAHLRRFASCGLDSLCFAPDTDTVHLVPHDAPQQATEIARSLTSYTEIVYAIRLIRNHRLDRGWNPHDPEPVRAEMRKAVADVEPWEGRAAAYWSMVIARVTTSDE